MAKIIKKTTISKKASVSKVVKKPIDKKILTKHRPKIADGAKGKPIVTKPVVKVDSTTQLVKFVNKNIQISPRKLRLLVDEVRKLSPLDALARVKFINTKSARILVQALKNVIADAKNNFNLDTNTLKFDTIKADEAIKIKRMDKSHGSHFARGLIQKRHSRLCIIVKGIKK